MLRLGRPKRGGFESGSYDTSFTSKAWIHCLRHWETFGYLNDSDEGLQYFSVSIVFIK